ncbi:alpha-galactosidase [Asticcacaulis sp. AC460]|uniref:NPCBM/NEW2 domain-containing protein n=1 Tax=Asticcacaulis sp. AC460 TaxID=1282360 RepID=UPI0003C3C0FF|nr:NPCBM/NEW2 domain-containing protein [Asticcacaulis sp. AC460]ESQ91048.1 alpha-galactosidase [Asticcacaulis sp. AC460]
MKRFIIAAAAAALLMAPGAWAQDSLKPAGKWTAHQAGNAATPPMGWNSWNAFRTEVDEAKVMGAAQKLVDTGLAKLGYRYVNIDDGWWLKRRKSDGRMVIRTQIFPSAQPKNKKADTTFRPFTDKLHSMGLKAGIYSDAGYNACSQAYDLHSPNLPEGDTAERSVGLYGHVDQDIALYFKEWGFDYIKVDACGLNVYGPDREIVAKYQYQPFPPLIDSQSIGRTDVAKVKAIYSDIGAAIAKHNPDGDYVFSICNWGTSDVRSWGNEVGNLWRTSGDITPTWSRMLHTFDSASTRALYARPGAWNDPDMLFVGHGDFDANHLTEAKSHFSLWAMINAPLLIGYDLRDAPQSLIDIWGNAGLVRVNQDSGGNQAVLVHDTDDVQIFVKTLSDSNTKAVAIFNRGVADAEVTLTAEHLKLADGQDIKLTNLWTGEMTILSTEAPFKLKARETLVFEAAGPRALANGMYLSEIPGRIHVAEDGIVVRKPDPTVHQMISPWGGSTRGPGERPSYAGWGGAQADSTPYGQVLQISGQKFGSGIGVLSNSRMEVKAGKAFTRFEASVGVDDSGRTDGQGVKFIVYGDGRKLGETGELVYGTAAVALSVDITGVEVVELVAKSATEEQVVTWGDAKLLK